MKYVTLATSAFLTLVAGLNAATIHLSFEGLDAYTDFSLQGLSEDKTKDLFIKETDRNQRLKKIVGEDRTLEINFQDIDMAGDIQPWRNRVNADIRYVESIYPPSLKFTYTLKDANGKILAEGEESIRDLSFDFGLQPIGDSSFKYELKLLENWAQRTLPRTR